MQYHIFSLYRVCSLGVHVDHQHGLVTGFAIDKGVDLCFDICEDSKVILDSETFSGHVEFDIATPTLVKQGDWGDYTRGAKVALQKRFKLEKGIKGTIKGSLPVGGLSSSAAVLIAYVMAFAKNTNCIMCHHQPSIEKLQRTGVIVVDDNMKVLNMEEKPQAPKSTWAVPPFYIYLKKDLDLVRHSVENGCGKDAPGNLAHYMVDHTTMHAWPMSAGRFDIGSLDTYYEAVEKYK